ncbi:geranyl transferase [Pseudomonas abyssi]|jgi:geranylgeranyl diphosphate synthase type II|uniref:Geranyl transferase n=1 Tax=Pseudomonas abyssi TaxID=170540 RepID=A0A2A3MD80_9PSED|nr:farnesyl diphosphate synthase [Pseudomonas abyssi]MAC98963.1 geranyl transferase [Pseudomonadales bacterium]PBK02733.1 geranyl transferase [Pseudomonas abyssi]|tara:strand:- start:18633 stop:19520 length:888 start_codon:yes stop_codon:yes gene_type:complete
MSEFVDYLSLCQQRINAYLGTQLNTPQPRLERLYSAMRYSVVNGGKRVRPLLAYASCEALGGQPQQADPAAAAVELIHAYSLIHDDLPAMDDDDLRRGQPTCHRAFDEATAILAGDALQAMAFELLAGAGDWQPATRLQMVQLLGRAAGPQGMVGGQAIDLGAVGEQLDLATLESMHRHKTGALIRAAVQLGALASEQVDDEQLAALGQYADSIGLAFQVQDDILDIESDTSVLGKQQGADVARDKPTYPALLGLDGAHRLADQLRDQALGALTGFGPAAQRLRQLADYIVQRRF